MHTNFFSQIKLLNITGNLRLNILPQENGDLIVSLLLDTSLVKDKAANLIPPLVLKGSDSDLDNGFFQAISQPVQTTQSLLLNMQQYVEALDKANKESRIMKDKEDIQKKDKDNKRKKFDEQMKKVDDLVKLKKVGEAIGQLPELKQFPEFETEIKKKSQELRGQHSSLSLFADEPVTNNIQEKDTSEESDDNNDENNEDDNDDDNDEESEENFDDGDDNNDEQDNP
ncbi:MAG: PRTRC system protein E [Sediminibacterium sp.]